MATVRIALGNAKFPATAEESVQIAISCMKTAAAREAAILCLPENLVPGYSIDAAKKRPDAEWLQQAWQAIDREAAQLSLAVILGTERVESDRRFISTRITDAKGVCLGFQDKVQLDPSEEEVFDSGQGRLLFECGDLKFGVVICHEGWRYPETVRWAAMQGAHVVFHPHVEIVEDPTFRPNGFADPQNSFHEKAALCRAAENTCYFATVNCALPGSTTTSAVIDPEGRLISHQPHGKEGVLIADIDTNLATGLLARRLRDQDSGCLKQADR